VLNVTDSSATVNGQLKVSSFTTITGAQGDILIGNNIWQDIWIKSGSSATMYGEGAFYLDGGTSVRFRDRQDSTAVLAYNSESSTPTLTSSNGSVITIDDDLIITGTSLSTGTFALDAALLDGFDSTYFLAESSAVASYLTKSLAANTYEPIVTEGSLADQVIVTGDIKEGTILVGDMAANSIDSDQYVDGSIDRAHLANDIDFGTDFAITISTPYALGTVADIAALISPFRNYAITITTLTVRIMGGTSAICQIEQRTIDGSNLAGTDVWGSSVTAVSTGWTGAASSDFTVPLGYGLFYQNDVFVGDVERIMIKGRFTVD